MDNFAYLIFNIMTLLSGVVVLSVGKLWDTLNRRALAISYLLVSGGFIAWDFVATNQGHWGFNSRYTMGINIAGVPIEEILFFFTVPFTCLAIYLLIKQRMGEKKMPRNVLAGIVFGLFVLGLLPMSRLEGDYTFAVILVFLAATATIWYMRKITIYWRFWMYLLICFGLFFAANSFLTGVPIVTYADSAIIGLRIGTIPIEDFAYNFALLSFFVITYESVLQKSPK